ncbi:MAG: phosphatase PAP2 family protein [Candidatus Micrarchaeota archaeon]
MDRITTVISTLNDPLITAVSLAINDKVIFIALITVLIFLFEKRTEKILKIFLVLLTAFVLASAAKEVLRLERPCDSAMTKIQCPDDFSFPSNHAALAFTLALAFINKKTYPMLMGFAILTAFSRIYLGVHTFEDIVGGLVIAPIAYQTVEIFWKTKEEKPWEKKK